MKIPVIFIAAIVAVSASRPLHIYNSHYYDSPAYFESLPSSPLRSPFLNSFYPKQESLFRNPQSISINDDISKYEPLSNFQEERNFLDFSPSASTYLSFRKPHSFYQDDILKFQEDKFNAQDYRGPPPPIFKYFNKQMSHMPDERVYNSSKLRITNIQKKYTNEQPMSKHHQSLSSETHELGFASVVGVTSPDINPVIVDERGATTKTVAEISSTIGMKIPSMNGVQIFQKNQEEHQYPVTHSLNSAIFTSEITSTSIPENTTGSSYVKPTNIESMLNNLVSTTPATMKMTSAIPHLKLNLSSVQSLSKPFSESIVTYPESSKSSRHYSTNLQEFPAMIQQYLPIESLEQKIYTPPSKQNLILYETKNNVPLRSLYFQMHEKQHNDNNISPFKLHIPTIHTSTNLTSSSMPVKLEYQNGDYSRSTLPLLTGTTMHDFIQKNDHFYPSTQANSDMSSGSFYLLHNDRYSKQGPASNFDISLGSSDGKDYVQSASSFVQSKLIDLENQKFDLSVQEPFRLTEPMFTKTEYDQSSW